MKFFALFSLILVFTSCTTSQIQSQRISEEIYALAAMNHQKVHLQVELPCTKDCTLGSQSLLLLPLGRTRAPDLEAAIYNAFYESLVVTGITPVLNSEQTAMPLRIAVSEITMRTTDLIITRLVTTSIRFRLFIPTLPAQTVTHTRHKSYRSPFSQAVSYELRETIREAMKKIFRGVILERT